MHATTRAYTRAAQETASKERLMVLLFEAALKHMRQGARLLEEHAVPDALVLLTKASDIVAELAATLDPRHAPELADTLGEIYTFVSQRLSHAAVFRDAKAAREAERAFAPLVEGFQQAVASLQVQQP
jgi:flagellar secretion chaperone FliS